MNKFRKTLIFISLAIFLFMMVANVSAADLVVNKNTTHNDIDNWMKNSSTVKGNNLIFNISKYDLTDSLVVSKSINIKSNVKTHISFNKKNCMFNLTTTGINFSGLTLQHNGKGSEKFSYSLIFSNDYSKTVNMRDMNFILNNDYLCAVAFKQGRGNITNCNIIGNGKFNTGFASNDFIGNISKSSFFMKKAFSIAIFFEKFVGDVSNSKFILNGAESFGLSIVNWKGNFLNSGITSSGRDSYNIHATNWIGKLSGSKSLSTGFRSAGVFSNSSSKNSIYKSSITSKKGYAVMVSKNVKIISSKLSSFKSVHKIYVFGPHVGIDSINSYTNKRTYYFKIKNYGNSKSKTSYLIIKANGFKKTVKIKPIKVNRTIKVKVVLPKKYSTSKFVKYATVQYINGYGKKSSYKASKFKW